MLNSLHESRREGSWLTLLRTLPKLFFLDGRLHSKLKVVLSEDALLAFCYPEEERRHYIYSIVCRRFQNAYSMKETADLVRRPMKEIHALLKNKVLDKPSGFKYDIRTKRPQNWYWSEDDVFDLRDHLYEMVPKDEDGFPRRPYRLASRAELVEKMQGGTSYYVKDQEGNLHQVWKAL